MDYSEVFANIEEAESVLGVPVLGPLSMISEGKLRLIKDISTFSPLMEPYRALRTHLRFRVPMQMGYYCVAYDTPPEGGVAPKPKAGIERSRSREKRPAG